MVQSLINLFIGIVVGLVMINNIPTAGWNYALGILCMWVIPCLLDISDNLKKIADKG